MALLELSAFPILEILLVYNHNIVYHTINQYPDGGIMKKFFAGSVVLLLGFVFAGCDTGNGGPEEDPFPIEGLYTLQVNNNTCKLEFKDGQAWEFTGYVGISSANKSGTYSVSGSLITMEYTVEGYTTSDTFTASNTGDGKITLKSGGDGAVSVFLSAAFSLAAKEVVLTVDDEGNEGPPPGPTQAEKNREIYNELLLGMWEEIGKDDSLVYAGPGGTPIPDIKILEFREDKFFSYYKANGPSSGTGGPSSATGPSSGASFALDYEYLFSLPPGYSFPGDSETGDFRKGDKEGVLCFYPNLPSYDIWDSYKAYFTDDGDTLICGEFMRYYGGSDYSENYSSHRRFKRVY
jgi:hypothetical protein